MNNIRKYFWGLNEIALREAPLILRNPGHPKFLARAVNFLSRCDRPKEVFSAIPRAEFIRAWPKIKAYWLKLERASDFRDWWQTVYEELVKAQGLKKSKPQGAPAALLVKIGRQLRQARLSRGFSQQELALAAAIPQPEISKIEEGRKNITLKTLFALCQELGIGKIEF